MNNNKNQMDPQDMKNLITFVLITLGIWLVYNSYIVKPRKEALAEREQARAELILKDPVLSKPFVAQSIDEALASNERLTFKNDQISGSISLKGGYIDDVILNHYFKTLDKEENIRLFTPARTENSRFLDYGWVTRNPDLNVPEAQSLWRIRGNAKLMPGNPVVLFWNNGQGLRFERHLALGDDYVFTVTQKVINQSAGDVVLHPYALITQANVPADYTKIWVAHEGPMGFIGGELQQFNYSAMEKSPNESFEAKRGWIGISDKYWLTALIPAQDIAAKYRFKYTQDVLRNERHKYQTDYTGAAVAISAGGEFEQSFHVYAGAKKVLKLNEYAKELGVDRLDLAVDFGWFWFFTYPFFIALHYLGLWIGNMGVAIIVLTAIIRMAVFPLTSISYRSFAKMKVVGPKISELREKHGDDKEKLQGEIVQLYQKEGVNPLSGCLPILLQIPFFFAFYKILLITIEIRHAPFFGWIQDLSSRDPTSVFNLFGLIPFTPPEMLMLGVWPCIMLCAMLVQKRLNPPPQDKMQRHMMNFFPFFITFIMAKFASGLVIYWAFSAILSILQQMYIMRSMNVPIYIFEKEKFEKDLEKKIDDGPDVHPLVEMAEDEAEKALFGEGEEPVEKPVISPPKPKKKTAKKSSKPKKKK